MDATGKRYLRISGGAMAACTAIVPVSIWMLRGREPTPLGYSIAFLPVIPSIFARFAFMRMFRGLDQLQRRIQLEAVAFSFLAACLITLTWAFQQNAGLPRSARPSQLDPGQPRRETRRLTPDGQRNRD